MKICILSYIYEDEHGSALAQDDLPYEPSFYLDGHDVETVHLAKTTATSRVVSLAGKGYDVFLNLCDGTWDGHQPGIEVVLALERMGLPFTGATSTFYEPSREAMKRVCNAWDVLTPRGLEIRCTPDIDVAERTLKFPLIVKHPNSYSSIGLTPDSRVETSAALRAQVKHMTETYGGALVEEFIEGREFTVLVTENPDEPNGPITYTPIEFQFPEGETFKHYDLKWVDHQGMRASPVMDPALDEELREASRRLFVGLGGTGYGRCDLRLDNDGRLYMLEINPNCAVFYPPEDPGSADFILLNDPAGHIGFVDQIIRAALARREHDHQSWMIRATEKGDYATWASTVIAEGECIQRYEEHSHILVTRKHVEHLWDERMSDWFARYAWPLTDDIWVMWSDKPDEWRPINHSCDPNAWLEGLDLVARRTIEVGEEITMDYATLYNERMPEFTCTCGASNCRGIIRGSDFLSPFVAQYGSHVSDYVRAKRLQLVNGHAPTVADTRAAQPASMLHAK